MTLAVSSKPKSRTTTAIRFPDDLHERLEEVADERGLSINYVLLRPFRNRLIVSFRQKNSG